MSGWRKQVEWCVRDVQSVPGIESAQNVQESVQEVVRGGVQGGEKEQSPKGQKIERRMDASPSEIAKAYLALRSVLNRTGSHYLRKRRRTATPAPSWTPLEAFSTVIYRASDYRYGHRLPPLPSKRFRHRRVRLPWISPRRDRRFHQAPRYALTQPTQYAPREASPPGPPTQWTAARHRTRRPRAVAGRTVAPAHPLRYDSVLAPMTPSVWGLSATPGRRRHFERRNRRPPYPRFNRRQGVDRHHLRLSGRLQPLPGVEHFIWIRRQKAAPLMIRPFQRPWRAQPGVRPLRRRFARRGVFAATGLAADGAPRPGVVTGRLRRPQRQTATWSLPPVRGLCSLTVGIHPFCDCRSLGSASSILGLASANLFVKFEELQENTKLKDRCTKAEKDQNITKDPTGGGVR